MDVSIRAKPEKIGAKGALVSISVRRLAALLASLASAVACAENSAEQAIPWAYSAYFGTGAYEVGDGEETYVIRAGPHWQLREPSLDEHGNREIGVELRLPVSLGVHSFDPTAIGSTLTLDNVATLSAVPGVEIEIPIGPRWSLKPLGYVGWGTVPDGDASAWIYWTGVKSRLRFPGRSFDWALLNILTYAGYRDDNGQHSSVLPLLTAVEFDRPLASKQIRGERVHLYWHVGYTQYLNEAELFLSNLRTVDLEDEWEVGMGFGTGAEPLRLWRLHWDRVGLAYRFSTNHQFSGISLVFGSLFDR